MTQVYFSCFYKDWTMNRRIFFFTGLFFSLVNSSVFSMHNQTSSKKNTKIFTTQISAGETQQKLLECFFDDLHKLAQLEDENVEDAFVRDRVLDKLERYVKNVTEAYGENKQLECAMSALNRKSRQCCPEAFGNEIRLFYAALAKILKEGKPLPRFKELLQGIEAALLRFEKLMIPLQSNLDVFRERLDQFDVEKEQESAERENLSGVLLAQQKKDFEICTKRIDKVFARIDRIDQLIDVLQSNVKNRCEGCQEHARVIEMLAKKYNNLRCGVILFAVAVVAYWLFARPYRIVYL